MKNYIFTFLFLATTLQIGYGQVTEISFPVAGACGMCEDRIEDLAITKGSAKKASWDVDKQEITVEYDESTTSLQKIKMMIAFGGHDNDAFSAPDDVYDNLHHCCKYRTEDVYNEEDNSNVNGHEDFGDYDHDHVAGTFDMIEGYIYAIENGKQIPLIGANVKLNESTRGTTTDNDGYFGLDNSEDHASAIEVSYIGYETTILSITEDGIIELILNDGHELDEVEITYKKRTTEVSFIKPRNVEIITRDELCKAACCNLSESFETNPSVDVSFPDAISGTRQIQMLGLTGPYVQITRELIPDVRAMSTIYGLSMTPGPWIESIQLIKGVGSVVNGYESIAGQINVEMKKPEKGELLHINGYANNGGRIELNANLRKQLTSTVSTNLLVHGKRMNEAHDNNGDSFTDMPLEQDYLIANRWKFEQTGNWQGQLGVKVSKLNHRGGTHDHYSGANQQHEIHWRMNNKTDRQEVWGKLGYINQDAPENSVGLQMSLVRQDQDGSYGNDAYDTEQRSLYTNLIFQRIPNDNHIIRTGITYQIDNIYERVDRYGIFDRTEYIPGAYFEYTYKQGDKWSIIPGIRADRHNNYGTIVTPRIHAKYNFSENSIVRITGGKGWRTANIFAENIGVFSTNRTINIAQSNVENPYGLDPEIAWNYGVNFTQGWDVNDRQMIISLDAYRTSFENKIVVDLETPGRVSFYNLEGDSYSNSIQAKVDYELFDNFDVRVAYRLFDVKTNYGDALLENPLVSKHRAFVNSSYKTDSDWHFDLTVNWNGQKRLPNTQSNPEAYRREEQSPNYFLVNAQVMKRWNDVFDIYLGAENLLNYKQNDAIIAADDPFGEYFDASIVWAPLFGANIYLGFRYNMVAE